MKTTPWITTADGSPSLIRDGEAMHSSAGALGETLYIYGEAIDHVLKTGRPPHFLVVGLGLGYIEWMIIARCLSANLVPLIWSFESDEELRTDLRRFLTGGPTDFFAESLRMTETHFHRALLPAARALFAQGRWQVRGELTAATDFPDKFSAVCYDVFSRKTNPGMWSEEFLKSFLLRVAGPACVFATYACNRDLKKNLNEAGFIHRARPGFGFKRESSFAVFQG